MTEDKDPYLAKWLNNDLTPQALEQFEKSEEFDDYDKIVKGLEYFEAPSFNEEASLMETLQKLQQPQKKGKIIRLKPFIYAISAAASILIIMGLFFNKVTHTADQGTQLALILPDDSRVDLNAGSSITYHRFFWSGNRVVTLDGEGLFSVKTGENFIVATDSGTIEVLGTVFNVKSRTSVFEVTCYEGKVRVGTNSDEQKIIQKGEAVSLKNGSLYKTQVSESEPLWKKGESLFISTPLKEVLDELERQYNITFNRIAINENKLFSGGFLHNNLDIALESVLVPMNLEYIVNGTNVKLSDK